MKNITQAMASYRNLFEPLVVDLFSGGGGASVGIERAIGRPVDIAIDHNAEALAMHEVNHPGTTHLRANLWEVDPLIATEGRPVSDLWASPDCTHHSKARGCKPIKKRIRSLAWVIIRWAREVGPTRIRMENVEEFLDWGPVMAKRDERGRVVHGKDGKPVFIPNPKRRGLYFRKFVQELHRLGYVVDWRILRACDFGAPTTRKRFFLQARCDGQLITWPKPTHNKDGSDGLAKWRPASECIEWDKPCRSIFGRENRLAVKTEQRIAKGIVKHVIDSKRPFLVNLTHGGKPKPTDKPFGTILHNDRQALACAILKHYGGVVGQPVDQSLGTVTAKDHHSLLAAVLTKFRGTSKHCQRIDAPAPSVCAQGQHESIVLSHIVKYYGNEKGGESLRKPMATVVTKDRMAIVNAVAQAASTGVFPEGFWQVWAFLIDRYGENAPPPIVEVDGEMYLIVDISMRMLTPRELFRAQGFPDSYVIDFELERVVNGKRKVCRLPASSQVRMCGNSVPPPVVEAMFRADMGYVPGKVAA
jgi:DNA (cytosine-5)-methyltransferase 1